MTDYFSVFGLPRKLQIEPATLQQRFYELSRQYHPDFHQGASATQQADVLARSALVNRAYRALRDPLERLEYLITLEEGRVAGETGAKPKAPTDLLAEMLEIQEALEEAKTAGLTPEANARLHGEWRALEARRAAEEAEIVGAFADWDRAIDAGAERAPLLDRFKRSLGRLAYLTTVIDDLTDALGEGEGRHVAHRRH